jgi:hypothetical protein
MGWAGVQIQGEKVKSVPGKTRASTQRHQLATLQDLSGSTARVLSLPLGAADRGSHTHAAQRPPWMRQPPAGCLTVPPAPVLPPAPRDGFVASEPLEVVDRRPVAIMDGI